ncbi:MAG: hypothetical protein QOG80_3344 [Pseudonocardiales bacterium]|nr:hypothetical protein [Pseudonocardiales bacterium]
MTDIWPTIHAERQSLADEVGELTPEQWHAHTMCGDWDVHDVLAHLVSAAKMTPPKFAVRFAAAGFNFDKFAGKQVKIEGAGGPQATLAAFRAVQQRTTAPPGPKDTWLGEAFVHGADIRRALGIRHEYPLPFVARTVEFYSKSNAIIGGRDRIAGLTLTASDTEFAIGDGPVVEGPVLSLLLAASGRKAALDDLTGPGVDTLRTRP